MSRPPPSCSLPLPSSAASSRHRLSPNRAPSAVRSQRIPPQLATADDGRLLAPRLPGAAARPARRHRYASRLRRARSRRSRGRPPGCRAGGCSTCSAASTPTASRFAGWSRSTPTAAATSARSRPTTPRRSTAASSTARRATRSMRTVARSTSTRSRTPTSRAPVRRHTRTSRPYVRRTPFRPGMAVDGHALVRAFDADRLGLGRPLVGSEGLSALLRVRPLRSAVRLRERPGRRKRVEGIEPS